MTTAELFTVRAGDMLHYHEPGSKQVCARIVGPRGGVTETVARVKVTSVKTWKRDPNRIEVRWQHGLRTFGVIDAAGAQWFHKEKDCPAGLR